MPETDIDKPDVRRTAERKAVALGLDSFVLWNVRQAKLYVRLGDGSPYDCAKIWNELAYIRSRETVLENKTQWQSLAREIISYVNDLLEEGRIEGKSFVAAYQDGKITDLVMSNTAPVADALKRASARDPYLRSEIQIWWGRHSAEYKSNSSHDDKHKILARANLLNWIGKFLFSHILQGQDTRARPATHIDETISPAEALDKFKALSTVCDFWTIFSGSVGLTVMPDSVWRRLCQINALLCDLKISSIGQNQLSGLLESVVNNSIRKTSGQYATPQPLAALLVRLCVRDITNDRILDPCCGSGTIARDLLEYKLLHGTCPNNAAKTVYASDLDPLAMQIATFSITRPALMDVPLHVFIADVFNLEPNTERTICHPKSGEPITIQLGRFDAVVSNLPFVSQQGRRNYKRGIDKVTRLLEDMDEDILSRKSDIAAYIPFVIRPLLKDGGRLGIIITNAWLGTDWGDSFFRLLCRHYRLLYVITSGAGRWFKNSDIVTNILVMEKQSDRDEGRTRPVDFIVLEKDVVELSNPESAELVASRIQLGEKSPGSLAIRKVDHHALARFSAYGLRGNAQFVDCDWILKLPFASIKRFFKIRRGERRGWDKLFFPTGDHTIEDVYIKRVIKRPQDISGYVDSARGDAFCCSVSLERLKELGHHGALAWIRSFENSTNLNGKLLPQALERSGHYWYEMKARPLTNLVMPLNFGNRLFVSKIDPAALANQRLICFNAHADVDLDLCHAILNSTISFFIIEGMGFGRALGALDMSKNRVEKFMHILDPNQLDSNRAGDIKQAFNRLLNRDVLEITDELNSADRQKFDDEVIRSFGLNVSRDEVYDSFKKLISIRRGL